MTERAAPRAPGTLFTDDYWGDPHAALARLRAEEPVREVELPGGDVNGASSTWLVTRYADVRAAFADQRLAKDYRAALPPQQRAQAPPLPGPAAGMMLLNDPPAHTRLRRLVVQAFTLRRVAALRPRVEKIAAELLDRLHRDASVGDAAVRGAPVDLIAEYAIPLPMAVICELLGVPAGDRDSFGAWSNTMIDDSPQADKQQASAELAGYLGELVAAKRAEPDDALISGLVAAADEGDRLSDDEIVAMGMLLLIAGHETTATLVGNSVYAILGDSALRERLLADTGAMPAAVEEFLRWGSPVANAPVRHAAEDVEIGGVTIPAGATVTLSVAAANRDPDRFDAPELYDPDRETAGHVAFGHGIHFCLGASLARLEGEVALRALLDRFPRLAPAVDLAELAPRHSLLVHALRELPVLLDPATG